MRQVKTTVDLEKEDHYEKIIGSYLPGICCLRPGTNHQHFIYDLKPWHDNLDYERYVGNRDRLHSRSSHRSRPWHGKTGALCDWRQGPGLGSRWQSDCGN